MKAKLRKATRRLQQGQTLVMALMIMGVLLVLGVVFIALVNQNIRHQRNNEKRSVAFDLAEAGVRYVHSQMLNSLQGADWRPTPTPLPLSLTDPDYTYLRLPNPLDLNDHGGPDQQGPYTRLVFDRGRALVRVRYAPSDPTVFATGAVGNMLQPGLARNYTVIDSVGKAQTLALNDPTSGTLANGNPREVTESKAVIAFVSCGLIEHALFIDNKNHESRAADIGAPSNNGAVYTDQGGAPLPVNPETVFGTTIPMYNPGTLSPAGAQPIGGGIYCNTDLVVHGNVTAYLNSMLGDNWIVNGSIRGADNLAALNLKAARANGGAWANTTTTLMNNTANPLNSDNGNWSTQLGLLRDAFANGDAQGYNRAAPYKDPPAITRVDADTGLSRYVQMSQFSGRVYNGRNSGIFGHGQSVFINNSADIQVPVDEQGREDVGSAESLFFDWLNPNNGQANSGWKGAFYVPRGAYLKLTIDGFIIIRDGRAPANQRTWKEPDGSAGKRAGAQMNSVNRADILDSPYCRFKLVKDPNSGQVYIFNSYSVLPTGVVIDLNAVTSASINTYRAAGYPFGGILYFQGNVRVRGQIPTDMQLTVVSNATIYIEGSITKGMINQGTRNLAIGAKLDSPSKSMIALLAKDNVAINTTEFFGSQPQQALEEVKDNAGSVEWNPVRVRTGGGIGLITEFSLDPNTTGGSILNPSTWQPYAKQYVEAGSINGFGTTNLLLWHSMDDGPAPATFLNINVNDTLGAPPFQPENNGSGEWQYLFELNANNAASPFLPIGYVPPHYTVTNRYPLYGLGTQSWQRYAKFEGAAFPLIDTTFNFATVAGNMEISGSNTSGSGLYHILVNDTTGFDLGLKETVGSTPTNDYVLARAAVVPHDIRIEATMFAEEGSFFVIPGPWFNANPDDRRDQYLSLGATQAERDLARQEKYGAGPNMPFYGEPLDVRVSIFGSITENMPPPISQQAEWIKKWGWIPRYHGATGELIPQQHTSGVDVTPGGANNMYVPNLTITYDPSLATDRNIGFVGSGGPNVDQTTLIRFQGVDLNLDGILDQRDAYFALPPLPRLPVSPTLAYFGEVNP